jgi:hypothetical protein
VGASSLTQEAAWWLELEELEDVLRLRRRWRGMFLGSRYKEEFLSLSLS